MQDLQWADMAFVSAMVVQRDAARSAIARCKAAGVKVVAGGPLFLGEYTQFEEVDHFVLNEAELTLPQFLTDLEHGCAKRVYESEGFADTTSDAGAVVGPARPEVLRHHGDPVLARLPV